MTPKIIYSTLFLMGVIGICAPHYSKASFLNESYASNVMSNSQHINSNSSKVRMGTTDDTQVSEENRNPDRKLPDGTPHRSFLKVDDGCNTIDGRKVCPGDPLDSKRPTKRRPNDMGTRDQNSNQNQN